MTRTIRAVIALLMVTAMVMSASAGVIKTVGSSSSIGISGNGVVSSVSGLTAGHSAIAGRELEGEVTTPGDSFSVTVTDHSSASDAFTTVEVDASELTVEGKITGPAAGTGSAYAYAAVYSEGDEDDPNAPTHIWLENWVEANTVTTADGGCKATASAVAVGTASGTGSAPFGDIKAMSRGTATASSSASDGGTSEADSYPYAYADLWDNGDIDAWSEIYSLSDGDFGTTTAKSAASGSASASGSSTEAEISTAASGDVSSKLTKKGYEGEAKAGIDAWTQWDGDLWMYAEIYSSSYLDADGDDAFSGSAATSAEGSSSATAGDLADDTLLPGASASVKGSASDKESLRGDGYTEGDGWLEAYIDTDDSWDDTIYIPQVEGDDRYLEWDFDYSDAAASSYVWANSESDGYSDSARASDKVSADGSVEASYTEDDYWGDGTMTGKSSADGVATGSTSVSKEGETETESVIWGIGFDDVDGDLEYSDGSASTTITLVGDEAGLSYLHSYADIEADTGSASASASADGKATFSTDYDSFSADDVERNSASADGTTTSSAKTTNDAEAASTSLIFSAAAAYTDSTELGLSEPALVDYSLILGDSGAVVGDSPASDTASAKGVADGRTTAKNSIYLEDMDSDILYEQEFSSTTTAEGTLSTEAGARGTMNLGQAEGQLRSFNAVQPFWNGDPPFVEINDDSVLFSSAKVASESGLTSASKSSATAKLTGSTSSEGAHDYVETDLSGPAPVVTNEFSLDGSTAVSNADKVTASGSGSADEYAALGEIWAWADQMTRYDDAGDEVALASGGFGTQSLRKTPGKGSASAEIDTVRIDAAAAVDGYSAKIGLKGGAAKSMVKPTSPYATASPATVSSQSMSVAPVPPGDTEVIQISLADPVGGKAANYLELGGDTRDNPTLPGLPSNLDNPFIFPS